MNLAVRTRAFFARHHPEVHPRWIVPPADELADLALRRSELVAPIGADEPSELVAQLSAHLGAGYKVKKNADFLQVYATPQSRIRELLEIDGGERSFPIPTPASPAWEAPPKLPEDGPEGTFRQHLLANAHRGLHHLRQGLDPADVCHPFPVDLHPVWRERARTTLHRLRPRIEESRIDPLIELAVVGLPSTSPLPPNPGAILAPMATLFDALTRTQRILRYSDQALPAVPPSGPLDEIDPRAIGREEDLRALYRATLRLMSELPAQIPGNLPRIARNLQACAGSDAGWRHHTPLIWAKQPLLSRFRQRILDRRQHLLVSLVQAMVTSDCRF